MGMIISGKYAERYLIIQMLLSHIYIGLEKSVLYLNGFEGGIMMKNVIIITFDEMQSIMYEFDDIIDNIKKGVYERQDGKIEREYLIKDLEKLKSQFE